MNDLLGLEREYYVKRVEDLKVILSMFQSLSDQVERFHGNYSLVSAPQDRYDRGNLDIWSAEVTEDWDDLAQMSCWLYGDRLNISLRWDLQAETASLRIEAETRQELENIFAPVHEKLESVPVSTGVQTYEKPFGLRRRYRIPSSVELPWFQKAVTALRSSVGPVSYFNGRFVLSSAPGDHKRGDLDTWYDEVTSRWAEIVKADCSIGGNALQIRCRLDFQESEMALDVDARTQEDLDELYRAVEQELGLEQVPEGLAAPEKEFGQENRYYRPKPDGHQWFEEAVDVLLSHAGQISSFRGNFWLASAPQSRHERTNLDIWRHDVASNWAKVIEVDCWLRGRDSDIDFRCDFQDQEATVEIRTRSQQTIGEFFGTLEAELGLEKLSQETAGLEGFRRSYLVQVRIDQAWFEKALRSIRAYTKGREYFRGEFRVSSAPHELKIRREFDKWKRDVLGCWDELIWTYCWVDSRSANLRLDCDHRRERIELGVQARTPEEVETIFQELIDKLKLELIEDRDAYPKARSRGEYRLIDWTRAGFAEAVEVALEQVFPEGPPAVVEGETWLRSGEAMEHFTDVQSFIARAKQDVPYEEAHLIADGIQGRTLGIHLEAHVNRFVLASSLEKDRFPELFKVFDRRGRLRLSDLEDQPEPGEPSEGKSGWTKLWENKIVIAVTTALVTFLLSSTFWIQITPDRKLQITVPRSQNDEPVELSTQQVRVEWVLETAQWFSKKIDRDVSATVRVLKDGVEPVQVLENQRPGIQVHLEPGMYDIEVVETTSDEFDVIRTVISAVP